jgi:hypothetical protein
VQQLLTGQRKRGRRRVRRAASLEEPTSHRRGGDPIRAEPEASQTIPFRNSADSRSVIVFSAEHAMSGRRGTTAWPCLRSLAGASRRELRASEWPYAVLPENIPDVKRRAPGRRSRGRSGSAASLDRRWKRARDDDPGREKPAERYVTSMRSSIAANDGADMQGRRGLGHRSYLSRALVAMAQISR